MADPKIINQVSWKIGGEAGFGIMASGTIFAKACVRAGWQVFDYSEYPSLIRGGHNTYQVFASPDRVTAHQREINILVALNRQTIDFHLAELTTGGIIIYDRDDRSFVGFAPSALARTDLHWIGLPAAELETAAGGPRLYRNTVVLGASFALLGLPLTYVQAVVREIFKDKGTNVIDTNLKVLQSGYQAITPSQIANCKWQLQPQNEPAKQMLLSGNDALGLGALQAGCTFFAGYPMTPATSILSFMAEHGPAHQVVVRQPEDELAVINETIGAAYTGARAMCATSGGGFALMTEAVGLAAMIETGLVIIEAQRGGPSTGLPTWTEQGDLRQVIHAGQGQAHKIVIAPGDHQQCFEYIQTAFNLADQWQLPVIVMTDKYLAEGHASVPVFAGPTVAINRGDIVDPIALKTDQSFRRYQLNTASGVSPRSLPGTPGGMFLANSDEHDELGLTSEDAIIRQSQMDRRQKKFEHAAAQLPAPLVTGPAKADLTVITWGSSVGPIRQALKLISPPGRSIRLIQIVYLHPFPQKFISEIMSTSQTSVVIEANQDGLLAGVIKQYTGFQADHFIRRYDGRPFDPVSLAKKLTDLSS